MRTGIVLVIALALLAPGPAHASVLSKLAKDAAAIVLKKGGKDAALHAVEALAKKIEAAALKHGESVIHAVKAVGPKALVMIEDAAAHGGTVAKVLAKHGEKGVVHVVERPAAMKLVKEHGFTVAEALVKHPRIGEGLIQHGGAVMIPALTAIGPQSARRLAIMGANETTKKLATEPKLLAVIGKHGDRAMSFIWRHRIILAGGAALAAFLHEPEPYLDGMKDITKVVAETAIKPLAEMPGKVLTTVAENATPEIAKRTNWTVVIPLVCTVTAVTGWAIWAHRYRQPQAVAAGVKPL